MSVVSAVALVAIAAYLAYGALANYQGYRRITALSDEFYKGEIRPEQLDGQIASVRQQLEKSPNPPLQLLLFDMLLFKAWYYPDKSVAPLREAIALGQELYRTLDPARGPIGSQLAVAYLYAGLPTKLPSWQTEVSAGDPQYRAQLSLLTFYSYIASDDLAGAQDLVDREVAEYGTRLEVRMMAAAAYNDLGLEHESRQQAVDREQVGDVKGNLRLAYAEYLLETGDLEFAEELLRANLTEARGDPDAALGLAVCLTMSKGVDDAEVQGLLDTAAKSTRDPRSRAGTEALCLAAAYELDGKLGQAAKLLGMSDEAGTDFHVLAALASLALSMARSKTSLAAAMPHGGAAALAGGDPVALAQQLLRAAETAGQRQDAELQLALALANRASTAGDPAALLAESASHFAAALGATDAPDLPATDRIPPYDAFLLDPVVMEIRQAHPQFDQALHAAVLDLLKRRVELFRAEVELPAVVTFTH